MVNSKRKLKTPAFQIKSKHIMINIKIDDFTKHAINTNFNVNIITPGNNMKIDTIQPIIVDSDTGSIYESSSKLKGSKNKKKKGI